MTILVTGATGTVGREIVKQLSEQGKSIRAMTRRPEQASFPEGVETVAGDLSMPESLASGFAGIEAMYWISIYEYDALKAAPRVAEMAKKAGIKRVAVMTGGGDETVLQAARQAGLACTHLQPGEFMSNTKVWAESIRRDGIVRAPFGGQLSAMIDEADIAAVAIKAILEEGHEGKDYLLTGRQELTRRETIRQLGQAIGRPIRYEELTTEQARAEWLEEGYTGDEIEWLLELGSWECISPATDSVETLTGRPARTFAQWAEEHAADFL
ncbi:NAD(P)H-binding protein [Paenibacillus sp. p3-SID867]|uniref:NmrA family NAD(P)-binding protein n=1 Tax=Paenibacillus sp. p3-SID867 TaxID=2916363 RepID=UPI0021A2D98F|nr:NAD(P)H-binding protein [Paenibacillus sp. p3-SID867]MCT1403703.1 NAD(P)H-binding protein [Paenibacillus sp. p3-SID867]